MNRRVDIIILGTSPVLPDGEFAAVAQSPNPLPTEAAAGSGSGRAPPPVAAKPSALIPARERLQR